MKKIITLLTFGVLVGLLLKNTQIHAQNMSGGNYFINYYKNNDANFVANTTNREISINSFVSNNLGMDGFLFGSLPTADSKYIIPVMVHIIEDSASSNPAISYAQVESQIDALNTHYNMSSTPIQFCLIKSKPNNVPSAEWNPAELGVVRYNAPGLYDVQLSISSANSLVSNTWPAPFQKVLNIWVVNSIDGNCSGIRAYCPVPLTSNQVATSLDGIVIQGRVFGDNTPSGNSFPLIPHTAYTCTGDTVVHDQGKILVREVGHYLNLWNTFQNNLSTNSNCAGSGANCSSDGDFCCDTHPVEEPLTTFISGSSIPQTCSNPQNDAVDNFMYFADDNATNHFTTGQYNRMLAFLLHLRTPMTSPSNLQEWGLIGGSNACVAPQIFAGFEISGNRCVSTTIDFEPSLTSPNNTATSWTWSVNPNSGVTMSGQNTAQFSAIFATAGNYTISCTASDGTSNVTHEEIIGISNCTVNTEQIHNAQWYFGQYAAWDFTGSVRTDNPTPRTNTTIFSQESTTALSDAMGTALFYTNGGHIWNGSDVQLNSITQTPVFPWIGPGPFDNITNSNPLSNHGYQAVMSCPVPGLTDRYFVFGTPDNFTAGTHNLQYAIVDLSSPPGVVNPTIPVICPSGTNVLINPSQQYSEAINLIPHCNGKDYWLLAKRYITGYVDVFFVSEYGVSATPVSTSIWTIGNFSLKASPNNDKIATIVNGDLAVIGFDNSQGTFTTIQTFTNQNATSPFQCSFNSSATKVYTVYQTPASIFYLDISIPTPTFGTNPLPITGPQILTMNEVGIQLAPDDNIYLTRGTNGPIPCSTMSRITEIPTPMFENNTELLNTTIADVSDLVGSSIPNQMDGEIPTYVAPSFSVIHITCSDIELSVPNCWDGYDYEINWGDGSPNTVLTSLPQNVPHSYGTPNTYTIVVTWLPKGASSVPVGANAITANQNIIIHPTPTVTAAQDVCDLVATASGGTPGYSYSWVFNSNVVSTAPSFTPAVNGLYTVTVTDVNSCTASATVNFSTSALACCAPGANPVFSNLTTLKNHFGTGNFVSNQTFWLTGNFIIDDIMTFNNCTIYMEPNSEVIVDPSKALILSDNTHMLAACDEMWVGLRADQVGSIIDISGNCTIEDMERGILVEGSGRLDARDSKFWNNLNSIYLKNLPFSYSGVIYNNNFSTTNAYLLPPHNGATRGNHGVFVLDCEYVRIGNISTVDGTFKNTFENLLNGIYVENTMSSSPNLKSRIYTSHNVFRNIRGGVTLWGSNSTGSPYNEDWLGSAIYGNNHVPAYDAKIFHHGNRVNVPSSTIVTDFEECDEAVLTNSFKTDVWQSHMVKCDAGCMFYGTNGLFYDIYDNKIEQAYAGIHFNGNTYSGNAARNEILDLQANPITKPGIPNHIIFYGRGIASHHFSSGGTSGLNFYTNTIKTKAERGIIGIDIFKAPPSVSLTTNYVYFESSSSNVDINTEPSLRGINLTLSEGARISHNEVYGLNTPGFLNNRHATGMYMLRSKQNLINCNIFSYVRYGNYVVGDCSDGTTDKVNGNQHNAVRAGILFRHLGDEGQLGDIGNSSYDANNKFYGTNLLGQIHRLCGGGPIGDTIFTVSPLNRTSDPVATCHMQQNVGPFPEMFELCNNGAFEEPQEMIGVIEEEEGGEGEGETEDVAGKNVIPTGGKSMDDQELSEDMANDPTTEQANPILNQFYTEEQRSAMAQLYETDIAINAIFSSASMADPELYNQNLEQAITLNNSVLSTEPFELQERAMNSLFFKLLQGQSLTESEWADIEVLANKCAYIDGYGVFKARTLYTMKVPGAHFDDLPICNKVGYNKGGKNPYDIENESLEVLPKHNARQIHIYPNPAHTFVTIDFDYDANNQYAFEIYDMSGRRILKESVRGSNSRINLMETAIGIYTYKLLQGDVVLKSGKLIIE